LGLLKILDRLFLSDLKNPAILDVWGFLLESSAVLLLVAKDD
jgi:hypothetical protein